MRRPSSVRPGARNVKKRTQSKYMNADSHIMEGNALLSMGLVDEAIEEYRGAIEKDPQNAEAHYNLGLVYRKSKRLDEAAREYREAIRIDPKKMSYHNNLATALIIKGDRAGAIKEYEMAIRMDPAFDHARFYLGMLKQKMSAGKSYPSGN